VIEFVGNPATEELPCVEAERAAVVAMTCEEETAGVAIVDAAAEEDAVAAKDAELEPDKDEEFGAKGEVGVAKDGEAEAPDEEIGAIEPAIEVVIDVGVEEGGTVIETYWNPET
jgi:hypothetical protein